ncbi:GntR family transcriptional regulator [Ruegeria lacuscaerulensis]|uniref:GntR family transcriptional regulator n=1 Tax=Ruegeria lacuscaerulensis TaxID=55218 RepID=UPI00147CD094|nr:GntR family transcriptional regulator [Ruegeria lacuscaerulensis]
MPRPDRVFKSACNAMLDRVMAGAEVSNISQLARHLGVSRTTVRAVLTHLVSRGLLARRGRGYDVQRLPEQADYFSAAQTMDTRDALEAAFMQMIRNQDLGPGTRLSEGQLARQLDVSVQTIREFLIGLSRFGFVRKDHHRRWVLEGVTRQYALELHEVRVMFESRAVENLCCLPEQHPFWGGLARLRQEHQAVTATADLSTLDFPALDTKFHRFLNDHAGNRLIVGFQDAIAMIFNHHYLWPLENQLDHHLTATADHLAIIDSIERRDKRKARAAMAAHLDTTRRRFAQATAKPPDEPR